MSTTPTRLQKTHTDPNQWTHLCWQPDATGSLHRFFVSLLPVLESEVGGGETASAAD